MRPVGPVCPVGLVSPVCPGIPWGGYSFSESALPLLLLLLLPWTARADGTPQLWPDVFAYCQEVSAEFGPDGKPVVVHHAVLPPPPPDPSAPPFDPDGEAAQTASDGNPALAEAFLAWLDKESSESGETVLVAGTDADGVYVLTEHGAAARALKRYDMASGQAEWLTDPEDHRELAAPLFLPGKNGAMHLAALVWQSPEGAHTEWRAPFPPKNRPPSGAPGSVRAEPKAHNRDATATRPELGRDGARPSQVFGQAGMGGDSLGGPCSVRAAPKGYDREATGPRPAPARDKARPSQPAQMQVRLGEAFPGANFDWLAPSPDGKRWLVRARHRDRPPTWLCVDVESASWEVLAECPVEVSPTVRTLFRWTASDGESLTGVFTRPAAPGPHPLVVFPHGGPGALSTTDFDERVWALADAGFAVFQPNYRGSAGFGKAFRFAGWGSNGIRRALLDVREGTTALLADPATQLDDTPPVLFGGSWGGYVALAELALFPEDWTGAVSFFGAFDLPKLLRSELERAREGETPIAAERTRRSLQRQFGNPAVPADMEALAALSPVNLAEAIRAPVILFHNRSDRVIDFEQSECMASALRHAGRSVEFHAAEGAHGWSPSEEAELYGSLVGSFRLWSEKDLQGLRTPNSAGEILTPAARLEAAPPEANPQ